MSPEEIEQQKMLLNLMGNIYGESRKIDQNLVGSAKDLRPISDGVKQMFEGALRAVQPPPPPQPQPQMSVPPPQAVNLPYYPPTQNANPIQLMDNSELVSILKGIESNLGKLVEVFNQYDVKVKKSSSRKVSRVVSEDKRSVHNQGGDEQAVVSSDVRGQHTDPVHSSKPFE